MKIEHRTRDGLTVASPGRLVGHAAIFDSPADLGPFVETVRRGAFARSLQHPGQIMALYNHGVGSILGRVSAGTLKLHEDERGLAFELQLPDTSVGRDLAVLVERGDVRGCSFGFTVPRDGERWGQVDGKPLRELRDVNLHEITITAVPAYVDTAVALRSMPSFWDAPGVELRRRWLQTV